MWEAHASAHIFTPIVLKNQPNFADRVRNKGTLETQ